jgi:hypothetical protein
MWRADLLFSWFHRTVAASTFRGLHDGPRNHPHRIGSWCGSGSRSRTIPYPSRAFWLCVSWLLLSPATRPRSWPAAANCRWIGYPAGSGGGLLELRRSTGLVAVARIMTASGSACIVTNLLNTQKNKDRLTAIPSTPSRIDVINRAPALPWTISNL